MTSWIATFLSAFVMAVVLTPAMIRIARRLGAHDRSDASHRKIHAGDIPRLGGVAIVVAFYAPLAGLTLYQTDIGQHLLGDRSLVLGMLGGGGVIAALGLWDDLRGASPRLKFGVQLGVAVGLVALGLHIRALDLPFLPVLDIGWWGIPLTILWVVGVTNAVNLIDGLDGLAGGMALFALAPMVVLATAKGDHVLALVCLALAGAVLGFLVFNFHPARIFMGDTGSMFLGFMLAVVTVTTSTKRGAAVALVTPVLVLGLPILDTLLAIARRAWFGQSLFVGDKQHIHHRLLDAGHSHRGTVLVMYGFAALFALLGLGMHFQRNLDQGLLFVGALIVAGILLRKVGYAAVPADLASGADFAAAIRERNRLVQARIDGMADGLGHDAAVAQVCEALFDVAHAAGAREVEFIVSEGVDAGMVRVCRWPVRGSGAHGIVGPDAQERTSRELAVCREGGPVLARLRITWDHAHYHDAAMPRIESACRRVAPRLEALGREAPLVSTG